MVSVVVVLGCLRGRVLGSISYIGIVLDVTLDTNMNINQNRHRIFAWDTNIST